MIRFTKYVMAALLALTTTLAAAAAATDPVTQELVNLNRQVQVATKNYDDVALARLITSDYVLISSSGKIYDRAAFLADVVDRSAIWEINEPEDVSVHVYTHDCAVVTAILHMRFRVGERLVDTRVRYADLWINLDGRWRYALGQASPLKPPLH